MKKLDKMVLVYEKKMGSKNLFGSNKAHIG